MFRPGEHPKSRASPVAATTDIQASSYRTDEGAAVRDRSVSLVNCRPHQRESRGRREQTQVLIFSFLFIKYRQRLAPCHLLLIVDPAEIENGSLHRFARSNALVFYNAEVAMILAVSFAMDAAQKHADCRLPELQGQREDT